jgi:hypothetical protein
MPESEPGLIRGYLDTLAARLPASVTDELADGLTETYQFHRSRGLAPEAAAKAAVAEFGPAEGPRPDIRSFHKKHASAHPRRSAVPFRHDQIIVCIYPLFSRG